MSLYSDVIDMIYNITMTENILINITVTSLVSLIELPKTKYNNYISYDTKGMLDFIENIDIPLAFKIEINECYGLLATQYNKIIKFEIRYKYNKKVLVHNKEIHNFKKITKSEKKKIKEYELMKII